MDNLVEVKTAFTHWAMGEIGGEEVMKTLIKELEELEPEARKCYALDKVVTNMKSSEFLKIMIIDGCYLFISIVLSTSAKKVAANLTTFGSSKSVYLDFIRLENQIPFFILESIYEKYKEHHPDVASSFSEGAVSFLGMTILREHKLCAPERGRRINHLLHLAKMALFPPRPPPPPANSPSGTTTVISMSTHDTPSNNDDDGPSPSLLTETRSASELKAYGVKFQTPEVGRNAFLPDIHFHNGVLEIPRLVYNELTAPIFENFIYYETLYNAMEEYDVISYAWFMGSLIRDVKDVEVLVQSGVLQARINDAKEIVSSIKSYAGDLVLMSGRYHHEHLHRQLKEFCESGPHPLRARKIG